MHTISIVLNDLKENDIPFNECVKLDLNKFIESFDDQEEIIYRTQKGKLSFIINILLIYIVINKNIITTSTFFTLPFYKWLEEVIFDITMSTFEIDETQLTSKLNYINRNSEFICEAVKEDPTIVKLYNSIDNNNIDDYKLIIRTIIFDDSVNIRERVYEDGYNWITWYR